MYVHESRIRVRYAETDQMGVAHHANYLLWLEVARTAYLEAIGYRYRDLEERGSLLAVTEINCRYLAPLRYDDEVVVKTWVQERKRLKLDFSYELYMDETLVARASTVLGCLNRDGRPQQLPEEVEKAIADAMNTNDGNTE